MTDPVATIEEPAKASAPSLGPGSDTREILEATTTIAVVGMSDDLDKPAHSVPISLQGHGFRVIPVNPTVSAILGQRSYPALADVPEPIDVVQVFRRASEAPEIARQAVAVGARALWLQQGIVSDEARRIAEEGGLAYVEDRCMAVERARLGIRKG